MRLLDDLVAGAYLLAVAAFFGLYISTFFPPKKRRKCGRVSVIEFPSRKKGK